MYEMAKGPNDQQPSNNDPNKNTEHFLKQINKPGLERSP